MKATASPAGAAIAAPRTAEASANPRLLQDALSVASLGTPTVVLLEMASLALTGQAACFAQHAALKGRVGHAKTLRPTPANGRTLADKAPYGTLLQLTPGVVASARQVLRDQIETMPTHTANAEARRAVMRATI